MSQVLRVNAITGKYTFLDKEGKEVGKDFNAWPLPSKVDADVLMERIRQGYIQIHPSHYIVRLELTEIDLLEITELVTSETDFDGYPDPATHKLLTFNSQRGDPESYANASSRMAFIDLNSKCIQWLDNPLAEDMFKNDPLKVPATKWTADEPNDILTIATRYVMKGKPPSVTAIPVIFK